MTQEKRIVFDLKDIETVHHQCANCKGELVHRLDSKEEIPLQCPLCKSAWSLHSDLLKKQIRVLQDMRWLLDIQDPIVHLRFEIKAEE